MNNHTPLYLYVNKYKIMNKTCRMIIKLYLKPLWNKILETIKKFIKDNNITFNSVKEKKK
jgi:hypothetical protein